MTDNFMVTGLPRSRTAWWSVATCTPVSACVHEPLRNTGKFDDLHSYFGLDTHRFVGIADSGLSVQLGRILTEIKPRTLIVLRDPRDVMTSLVEYLPFRPIDFMGLKAHVDQCQSAIEEWSGHELVKTVPFDALRYPDVALACFDWLMPGHSKHMNLDLLGMNIQVCKERLMQDLMAEGHNMWHLR